jgi:hypothetical protein
MVFETQYALPSPLLLRYIVASWQGDWGSKIEVVAPKPAIPPPSRLPATSSPWDRMKKCLFALSLLATNALASGGPEAMLLPCLIGHPQLFQKYRAKIDSPSLIRNAEELTPIKGACLQKALKPHLAFCEQLLFLTVLPQPDRDKFEQSLMRNEKSLVVPDEKQWRDFGGALASCQ